MRTSKRRKDRSFDGDEGSVSIFVVIAAVAVLLVLGLVADGGARVRAVQRADALAAEAARAGGQIIDAPTAVGGGTVRVDRQGALEAAQAYLAAAGQSGDVAISDDARSLEVTVTITRPTVFLSLIGITTTSATGHATVTLVHAVTGATP